MNQCILFFSKYSNLSEKFLNMIKNYPKNIIEVLNISTVCIDNENIRKRILKSKNIKIQSVPSLLIITNSGEISLFENQTLFEWFNEQIKTNVELQLPPPPQPPPQEIQQTQSQPQPQKEQEQENVNYDKIPSKPRTNTKIDEIDLDEKFDESVNRRPPVAVRNNEGGYDLSNDFGEPDSPNRQVTNHIKSTTESTKGPTDLMSQALAMQKEREKVEPKNPLTPSNTT